MKAHPTRRLAVAAVLALLAFCAGAPAASAHGGNGQPIPDATHYLSKITGIGPATPGLTASVDPRGEWLEVSNTTSQTLTVLGYAREPYLQITPAGVWENSYSPTLALNQSLFGDISQLGDSTLPPNWRQTSTSHTIRWHDHRIHWMGATRPPAVKAHPERGQLVGNWTVHMTLADRPVTVTGTLSWLPLKKGTSRVIVWVLIADAVVLAGAAAATGLFARHRRATGARATGANNINNTTQDPSTSSARG